MRLGFSKYLGIYSRTLVITGILVVGLVSAFSVNTATRVSADEVNYSETCNVSVKFHATVPAQVEKGKSFWVTNITVQPTQTYGFNVTSSPFTMTATNTTSSTYEQDFARTDPSPTSGQSTYVSYYPDWEINATGAVGSNIDINIIKTVTVVQGYGKVTCNFKPKNPFASIKIVAPAATPTPSSSPSQPPKGSTSPKPTKSNSPSKSTSPSSSKSPTKDQTKDNSSDTDKTSSDDEVATDDSSAPDDTDSIVVSTLAVRVLDSSKSPIAGADVILDGSIKQTTNKLGGAVFPNVITGSHSITASVDGRKVSMTIKYSKDNRSKVFDIVVPDSRLGLYILLGVLGGDPAYWWWSAGYYSIY